jgi:hypothetical protein
MYLGNASCIRRIPSLMISIRRIPSLCINMDDRKQCALSVAGMPGPCILCASRLWPAANMQPCQQQLLLPAGTSWHVVLMTFVQHPTVTTTLIGSKLDDQYGR